MDFLAAAVIIAIIIMINIYTNSNKRKSKVLSRIRSEWGRKSENEFDERDLDRFSAYYNGYSKKKNRYAIDEITWSDLEMDQVYGRINSTHTSMGDEILYSMLRTPAFDKQTIEGRKRLIDFWSENREAREKVQLELERFGKFNDKGASVLLGESDYLNLNSGKLYKLLTFLPLLSIPVLFVNVGFGMFLLILTVGFNIFYHERVLKELDSKISAVSSATGIISLAGRLLKLNLKGLEAEKEHIGKHYNSLQGVFRRFSPQMLILRTGDPMTDLSDIPKMIFMLDIWTYDKSMRFIRENIEDLASIIEAVGLLDATISIASYRKSIDRWCVPEIAWEKESKPDSFIKAENVRHPMIESCTGNPVNAGRPVLLTGSNASGKSTYLKTVAINTLFAHTIMTCIAESWVSTPLFPITSIALRDNILNGESYFVAETKSLRRIFDAAEGNIRCLCIIDEVLRGTNTIERVAASSRLLSELAKLNTCVFAATHDVELTRILKGLFENKHFEESITDNEISFDYQLKEGRATSRNAIKLLGLLGFNPSLIEKCNEAVNDFEKNGQWSAVS